VTLVEPALATTPGDPDGNQVQRRELRLLMIYEETAQFAGESDFQGR
jgi:hypothetical protein